MPPGGLRSGLDPVATNPHHKEHFHLVDPKLKAGKCGAKKRGSTEKCQQVAGYRTPHPGVGACCFHGGNLTNHVLKHEREKMQADIARASKIFALDRKIDPFQALAEEVWRTAGAVQWLVAKVATLPEDPYAEGVSREESARALAWHNWLSRERGRLVEVSKAAIACGLAERQVKIAEEQGRMIAQAMIGLVAALGLDPNGEQARTAMRNQLMIMSGSVVDAQVVG